MREDRAQHLVPVDHVAQGRLSAAGVQLAGQAQHASGCCRSCSGPSSWLEEPQAAAARTTAAAAPAVRRGTQRRPGRPCHRPSRAASPATVGVVEHGRERELGAQHGADPADQPHRQQRVPAEREEVVVHADRVAGPAPRRRAAHSSSSRGGAGPAGRRRRPELRGGQRRRSSLPFGVSGSASSDDARAAGTMCSGSRSRANAMRSASSAVDGRCRPAPRRRPGARRPGVSSAADHDGGLSHVGVARSSGRPRSRRARRGSRGSSPGRRRGPANSSSPSAVQRARSPVRYIRPPPGRTGRPRTARRSGPGGRGSRGPGPAPAMYSSPGTPGGTGRRPSSST